MSSLLTRRALLAGTAATAGLALVSPGIAFAHDDHHGHGVRFGVQQVNLVSDVAGLAPLTDPDLVNPWGLSLGATTPLWVSNAGTDTSTLYTSAPGATTANKVPTVRVTFPGPGGAPVAPTGQVANAGTGFVLSNGTTSAPARFIFATVATGQIWAWSPVVDPLMGAAEVKATVPGAAYTGLALANDHLFAANFAQGRIDVFDNTFAQVTLPSWAFRDRSIPRGFAPFNAQAINGDVFVTYAKVDPTTGRSQAGVGLGFVDRYTVDGKLVARVAARQTLNAPWGLAIAPSTWGDLAGALLVGNFGDGRISVLEAESHGRFDNRVEGLVRDGGTGRTLQIPGLWALLPGTATTGGTDALWFSAGLDNETHGLLGVLRKP
jgi:uncharacterized protein (TIGR03118 family)